MVSIKEIIISEYYDTISKMMEGLHASEKELFDKSAEWKYIESAYMRHVIETQKEENGTCLLAFDEENPIGFIFGYIEEEDDSRTENYKGPELYVSDGYIMPTHRRKGIYRQLNEMLEKKYFEKGVRRIVRFTLSSNIRMQKFLAEEGYVAVRFQYEKWINENGDALDLMPQKS